MIAQLDITADKITAEVVPVRYTLWPDAPFQPVVLTGKQRIVALKRIAQLSSELGRTLPMLRLRR
jgi:hypothetical protein